MDEIIHKLQVEPIVENKNCKQLKKKIKDETRFFIGFSELLGKDYLLSKNIEKPISSSHIFLPNDFRKYNFNKEINDCYLQMTLLQR